MSWMVTAKSRYNGVALFPSRATPSLGSGDRYASPAPPRRVPVRAGSNRKPANPDMLQIGSGALTTRRRAGFVTIHHRHDCYSGLSGVLRSFGPLREEFVVGTLVFLNLPHPVAGAGADGDRSLFGHTSSRGWMTIRFIPPDERKYVMPPDSEDSSEKETWRENETITRPRGILSPKERAHLRGLLDEDREEDADAIRQREYRIRQHIYHAFLDFTLLATTEVAYQALDELGSDMDEVSKQSEHPHGLYTGVKRLMELLYAALGGFHPTDQEVTFTSILRGSVTDALVAHHAHHHGVSVIPRIEYDIYNGEGWELEEVMEIYDQYPEKYLLPEELDALYDGRKISSEEYREYADDIRDRDLTSDKEEKKRAEAYRRRGYEIDWKSDGGFDSVWPDDNEQPRHSTLSRPDASRTPGRNRETDS